MPAAPRLPIPEARFDERDTLFARAARRPGTPAYRDHYARRPEQQEGDDRARNLPGLLARGGAYFDEVVSVEADQWFGRIGELERETPEGARIAEWAAALRDAPDPTAFLEQLAIELGAVAAGGAPVDEAFYYTHKGRFDEDYGREIAPRHGHALVFLVEMDYAAMQEAPHAPTIRESARQYYRAARVSLVLEAVLREAGHDATAHYDAHYEVILPPLAVAAGLGELGRNNILVADRFGSRVRIGAVTTGLALRSPGPVDLGVAFFCEICKKCADNCPSNSLSTGARVPVLGVPKWPTDALGCYTYWRRVGTDCGICMACCPFSHEDNAFHNLVRWGILHSRLFARFALWCDDLIYGRDWKRRRRRRDGN